MPKEMVPLTLPEWLPVHPWWTEARRFTRAEAIVDLVIRAGADGTVKTAADALGAAWGWERGEVWATLSRLADSGLIGFEASPGGLTVSLLVSAGRRRAAPAIQGTVSEPARGGELLLFEAPQSQSASTHGATRRVWEEFVAVREELLKEDGRRVAPVVSSAPRLRTIRRWIERYGEDYILKALDGLRYSDWHRARGRHKAGPVRLTPEAVFHETSRVNQIELLYGLATERREETARRVSTMTEATTPDGSELPSGLVWSAARGHAVTREEWEAAAQ